jgi:beta-phosphoglucomutase-like phosphatase (HAD superfamily)
MATYGNYALRIPSSLMDDLRTASERDGVSMNSFIVQAVAEKVAALRARGLLRDLSAEEQSAYLAQRAARARAGRMEAILAKAGNTDTVLAGDELPEGWPQPEPAADRKPRQTVP